MLRGNMSYIYSSSIDSPQFLKEQLKLFAFNGAPSPSNDLLEIIQHKLTKREKLITLLEGDLNFHGENSSYASHNLHSFAAKFPPQLPRAFIRALTFPGDVILDPMMGSGTTLVEAILEGRLGIGFDIDPLALRLCRVKTVPLIQNDLKVVGNKVIKNALHMLSEKSNIKDIINSKFDQKTKQFIDYWFFPETQKELMALALAIKKIPEKETRLFLELVFSSIIVTKSGGVSRARDLAHSRPHLDKTKVPKNAIEQFSSKLRKNINSISELKSDSMAFPLAGDARNMPLGDCVIDLIVTSPPYANAIDYMRAHKFSLAWLGEKIGALSELRSKYIGSERINKSQSIALPDRPELIISRLGKVDKSKSFILRKYFNEMEFVLAEMYRVLKSDSAAIVVVGTSIMRNIDVETHLCIADIAIRLGFDLVNITKRILDRNKRMMPARFGNNKSSLIEQRMHDEYVIGLMKP